MASKKIDASNIMDSEALSLTGIWHFLLPYPWVVSLGRSVITALGGVFGNKFVGQLANVMTKAIIFFIFIFVLWVPLNVFFRFGAFWFASGYRIFNDVGSHRANKINGKSGINKMSVVYFVTYTFLFIFLYIPVVIPQFFGYIDYSTVLRWLKIM